MVEITGDVPGACFHTALPGGYSMLRDHVGWGGRGRVGTKRNKSPDGERPILHFLIQYPSFLNQLASLAK